MGKKMLDNIRVVNCLFKNAYRETGSVKQNILSKTQVSHYTRREDKERAPRS